VKFTHAYSILTVIFRLTYVSWLPFDNMQQWVECRSRPSSHQSGDN